MWKFEDDSNPNENRMKAIEIKAGLEELLYLVEGIVSLEVHIDSVPWSDSTGDIFVDCLFESREALEAYQNHAEHVKLKEYLKSCELSSLCMDFETHSP